MKMTPSPFALGATLYMPATRGDIADIIMNGKIPGLRSLVICLEDAISEPEVSVALRKLNQLLARLAREKSARDETDWPLIFIRPRHIAMGRQLGADFNLNAVDGFVLPKFTRAALNSWWDIVKASSLCLMPTLETEDVFDADEMRKLARALERHPCRQRIVALRIGGNDLLNVIAMRRSRKATLYDGPMGYVIKMLVAVFGARQFALTAPVCEQIDDTGLLEQELTLDMEHGLVGKTAIHPAQIEIIQRALMVDPRDHADALRILNSGQAVFKSQGAMCEPATHRQWAATILERVRVYGVTPDFAPLAARQVAIKQHQG